MAEAKKFVIESKVKVSLTEEDVSDLVITALCGGIGYWACLDNSTPEFEAMSEEDYTDEWTAKILLNGGEVLLLEEPDRKERFVLTLEKLLHGIALYIEKGYDHYGIFGSEVDMGCCDSECADMIVQLALFDDIVYG